MAACAWWTGSECGGVYAGPTWRGPAFFGTHPLACVLDVFNLGNAAARRLFLTAFVKALYRSSTEPLLRFVLDEAGLWVPQRVHPGGHDPLRRTEEVVRRRRVGGFVP